MLRLPTIYSRLVALGAIVTLGLCALGVISRMERNAADRHLASTREANAALKQQLEADDLHDMIRGDVYALLMTRTDSGAARVRAELFEHIAQIRENLREDRISRSYGKLAPASRELAELLTRYARMAEKIAGDLREDRLAAVTRLADFLDLYGKARNGGTRFAADLEQAVEAKRVEEEAALRVMTRLATGISLLIAAATMLLTGRLIVSIDRSLVGLRNHIERVAAGDLSASESEAGQDELGHLRHELERMTDAVRSSVEEVGTALTGVAGASESIGGLVKKVTAASDQQIRGTDDASNAMRQIQSEVGGIGEASGELRASADQSASAIVELRETCTVLGAQASALEGSVDESVSSAREFSQTAGVIANRTDRFSRSADDGLAAVSAVLEAGSEVGAASESALGLAGRVIHAAENCRLRFSETLAGMRKILDSERSAGNVVRKLGERAAEIGQIADVIDRIAEDTKLLALNAAIISAQSGEEGRAFTVVSDQIKEMAERARANTNQIHDLVSRVESETSEAVETMEQSLEVVEKEVARSHEAGEALEEISRAAAENAERVGEISEVAGRQAELCAEARAHMEGVRGEAAEIRAATGQQESSAKGLLERCEMLEDVGRAVAEASRRQEQETGHLAKTAERVRQATADIDAALSGQGTACSKVVDLLEVIRERTRQSADSLQGEVGGLLAENDVLNEAFRKFQT